MAQELQFEVAMKRLEEIVGQLERGNAPLDQSLALFEEGTKLIRHCGAALDRAEQQLKLLTVTPDGSAEVPFVGEDA